MKRAYPLYHLVARKRRPNGTVSDTARVTADERALRGLIPVLVEAGMVVESCDLPGWREDADASKAGGAT